MLNGRSPALRCNLWFYQVQKVRLRCQPVPALGQWVVGSILSRAPLGCLCANFAANQSRANRRFRAHQLAYQRLAYRHQSAAGLLSAC